MNFHRFHNQFAFAAITLTSMIALPAAGQVINEQLKLHPDDGAADDWFGGSVAISGTTALVGAPNDRNNTLRGSAYLLDVTTGHQIFKLLPTIGAERNFFGESVATSGNTAVIGDREGDDKRGDIGSAYLFDTTTGQLRFRIRPNDGADLDAFGSSVAISGTTVVVGSPGDDDRGSYSGSAYLFDSTTGLQLFKLRPSDGSILDLFGGSVAISGTTAIIGADGDDDNGECSGSAYLFDTTTGQQLFKLLPSDGQSRDYFGRSVAISGTTAIIGAPGDDDNGVSSGSAYLFDTTTGQQLIKLLLSDGAAFDGFGGSVAISGTMAILGANGDDNGPASGTAYLFDTTTGQQLFKLLPSDGAAGDLFGESVAISGNTVIVGAIWDDDNGESSGSAYLFSSAPSLCSADLNGDGSLNFFDISAFLTAYAANEPIADFNNDGSFNFFDVSAFLEAYLNGCP